MWCKRQQGLKHPTLGKMGCKKNLKFGDFGWVFAAEVSRRYSDDVDVNGLAWWQACQHSKFYDVVLAWLRTTEAYTPPFRTISRNLGYLCNPQDSSVSSPNSNFCWSNHWTLHQFRPLLRLVIVPILVDFHLCAGIIESGEFVEGFGFALVEASGRKGWIGPAWYKCGAPKL